MAGTRFIADDCYLILDGQDITDDVITVTFTAENTEQEFITMGSTAYETLVGNTKWSLEVEATDAGGATPTTWTQIHDIWQTRAPASLEFRRFNTTVSSSNPSYTGSVVIATMPVADFTKDEQAMVKVTLKGTGALTIATA